ncbi:MAG: hypothetical protein NZ898_14430 [Myxococcota bacterium]|nr:hypothetical protein [Myxococcota bacterium]MDW8361649.1 hypothetical protein [Myxococcales bacterium]
MKLVQAIARLRDRSHGQAAYSLLFERTARHLGWHRRVSWNRGGAKNEGERGTGSSDTRIQRTSDLDAQEAIHSAIWSLVRAVESGAVTFHHDGQVVRWLATAARNHEISVHRRRRRWVPVDTHDEFDDEQPTVPVVDVTRNPEQDLGASRMARALEEAWNRLVELATSRLPEPNRRDFLADCEQLWGLAVDEKTVADIVGLPETHEEYRKARNRLYQRHKRARERLMDAADALEQAGEHDAEIRAMLRDVITSRLTRVARAAREDDS